MRLTQAALSSLNTFGTLRELGSKQWPLQTLTVTFPDFTTEKAEGSRRAGFFQTSVFILLWYVFVSIISV